MDIGHRYGKSASARAARGMLAGMAGLAVVGLTGVGGASAQSLPGAPGLDYYPSWMHQDSPWVSGSDQDYDPLPGDRFNRSDNEFQAWRADQIRMYGTEYYKRQDYENNLLNWQETRSQDMRAQGAPAVTRNPFGGTLGGTVGGGAVTRDRDLGGAEPTLGR